MAKIKLKGLGMNQFGGFTPYGNVTTLRAAVLALATGSIANSNSTAPAAVGDKVYVQLLPAGMLLEDAQIIVSTALAAGVKASMGFEYVDGADVEAAPQDAAYFGVGIALDAVDRLRCASAKVPVHLAKEAFLVLTIEGAASTKAGRLDVIVQGERLGAQ